MIDVVLDEVNAGINGALYSVSRAGRDNSRWVGNVVHEGRMSEEQAVRIVATWVKNGVLYKHVFRDPNTRKDRDGLLADKSKVVE